MSDSSQSGSSSDNEGRGFWVHPITQRTIDVLIQVVAGLVVWRITS